MRKKNQHTYSEKVIAPLAESLGVSTDYLKGIAAALFIRIKIAASDGDKISVPDFGTFYQNQPAQRPYYHFARKEMVDKLPAKRLAFKPARVKPNV